jgi:prevent-host-death family protein
MIKVSASEFQRNFGRYQDLALSEAIAVTRNGRERTVLISADEYLRLTRGDRQVVTLGDYSDADIRELEVVRAPVEAKSFDGEVTP